MNQKTSPKLSIPPTFKDVLVGVDTKYRPISTDKLTSSIIDDKLERSKSFVSELRAYKENFIPDVSLLKLITTDEGLEFHIKVHDVEHEGKKINAWDFYQKNPKKVQEKILEYLSDYEELNFSNIRFEEGSLIVILGIKLAGIGIQKIAGVAIATGLTWALTTYFQKTSKGKEIVKEIDRIEDEVIKNIKDFVDDTITNIRNFFGGWFGNIAMGW